MGLKYENLDAETHSLMVEEVDLDIAERGLYESSYLTDEGVLRWPDLLRRAAAEGTDDSLTRSLGGLFRTHVQRRKPKGGYTTAAVPYTAAQTLAEAQFNMYYIRALCRRAIASGAAVVVYRAKQVEVPRTASEQMIGHALDAKFVLQVLRETKGVEPPTGVPMPNTGITVRLAP